MVCWIRIIHLVSLKTKTETNHGTLSMQIVILEHSPKEKQFQCNTVIFFSNFLDCGKSSDFWENSENDSDTVKATKEHVINTIKGWCEE